MTEVYREETTYVSTPAPIYARPALCKYDVRCMKTTSIYPNLHVDANYEEKKDDNIKI